MELCFRIADIDIRFCMPPEYIDRQLDLLDHFRVQNVAADCHRYEVFLVERVKEPIGKLIRTEPGLRIYSEGTAECRYYVNAAGEEYLRALHDGKRHTVQLQHSYSSWMGRKMIMTAMGLDHLVARHDGLILHASYIDYKGKAYIFTAPSGTGKSTQADLWVKHRGAELVNGDRTCIRVIDGKLYACGIPPAGSSNVSLCRNLPLAALVYLEQAPVTTIRELNGFQAFRKILEGCSVNTSSTEDLNTVSDVIQKIVEHIPVAVLSCTPDESAVIALEKMIESRK